MIGSEIIRSMMDHVDIIHDCPEMGIGLGVPRPPVKVYEDGDGYHLYQPSTDLDHTEKMESFVEELLERIGDVDGFILKAKSPSCGMGDVKIYAKKEKGTKKRMGSGFLGRIAEEKYNHLALETEKRLMDERIRDHFLTKLFTISRFRKVEDAKGLIDFHTRSKYLLMAYDQNTMRKMGRVVSSQKELGINDAIRQYHELLGSALVKGPRYTSHINVLMHCFGFVSSELTDDEKRFFLDSVEMYRDDRIPLSSLKTMVNSWIVRFNVKYLKDQYYFDPYPLELVEKIDKKRDRELWK
jgi:uncharacterized protein YbgA (DUF1722 family)/uncharacterized protein YbbK (DUF523 family)